LQVALSACRIDCDASDDMFSALEPIFDGSLIRLPTTNELLCPGTFVFFSTPGLNVEAKQMGRIIRSLDVGSCTVPVNVFQPPSSEDHIPLLNLSCLTETIQVIQTTEIARVK
jgi:hypothetical protein